MPNSRLKKAATNELSDQRDRLRYPLETHEPAVASEHVIDQRIEVKMTRRHCELQLGVEAVMQNLRNRSNPRKRYPVRIVVKATGWLFTVMAVRQARYVLYLGSSSKATDT